MCKKNEDGTAQPCDANCKDCASQSGKPVPADKPAEQTDKPVQTPDWLGAGPTGCGGC